MEFGESKVFHYAKLRRPKFSLNTDLRRTYVHYAEDLPRKRHIFKSGSDWLRYIVESLEKSCGSYAEPLKNFTHGIKFYYADGSFHYADINFFEKTH